MKSPIEYKSDFLSDADYLADILWEELEWLRIETTPRYEYYHALNGADYTYGSGRGVRTYKSQPLHNKIEAIWRLAENAANTKFDVVFLNGYKDQSDQLGWHADDSPEMDDNRPIAIVSLGAEREIWFREKPLNNGDCTSCNGSGHYDSNGSPKCGACDGTGKRALPVIEKLLLGNGSLCLMQPGMQDTHQHRIPKAGKVVGKRISLTFRGVV